MFFDAKRLTSILSVKINPIQYNEQGEAEFQLLQLNDEIEIEITQDMVAVNTQPVIKLTYQPNTITWLEKEIEFLNLGCLLRLDLLSILDEQRAYFPLYQTHKKWLLPLFQCVLDWLKEQDNLLPNQPINEVIEGGLTWENFD